jgi:hypothetical protein
MLADMTRRRFMAQTLGVIGGTMMARDLLPLLAAAAKRKQVLRVAIEPVLASSSSLGCTARPNSPTATPSMPKR